MNSTFWIIAAVVLVVLAAVIGFLYYQGNKMQKKQAEQQEEIAKHAQQMTMLVIDKKRLPLKDAGLPQMVLEQAPARARRAKVPVVKAKVGPRIMSLIASEDVYDQIPVKANIKAMVSGIYITSINNYRNAPVPEPEKLGMIDRLRKKTNEVNSQAYSDSAKKSKKK